MSVMLTMEGPIGVAFLTMVTVLMVSEFIEHTVERERESLQPKVCSTILSVSFFGEGSLLLLVNDMIRAL